MPSQLKRQIIAAFDDVPCPSDDAVFRPDQTRLANIWTLAKGAVESWHDVDANLLEQLFDGPAATLSLLTDEAFRFFLPAFLLADIDDRLAMADPAAQLCQGFDDATQDTLAHPLRYGKRTCRDDAVHRFAMLDDEQAEAVAAYLKFKRDGAMGREAKVLSQALSRYWTPRMAAVTRAEASKSSKLSSNSSSPRAQFGMRSLLVFMSGATLLLAVAAVLDGWFCTVALLPAVLALPACATISILYGSSMARTFSIGALFGLAPGVVIAGFVFFWLAIELIDAGGMWSLSEFIDLLAGSSSSIKLAFFGSILLGLMCGAGSLATRLLVCMPSSANNDPPADAPRSS
ncbi:MAG: hypothetical protein KDA61_19545 [Planctomycetales bacterium]|nr:hypothetical protein [Planctomycetales bacterium]